MADAIYTISEGEGIRTRSLCHQWTTKNAANPAKGKWNFSFRRGTG